jgi:hypothetical protein
MSHSTEQRGLSAKVVSAFLTVIVSLSLWTIHQVSGLGEDVAVIKREQIFFLEAQTNQTGLFEALDNKEQALDHRVTVLESTSVRTK